MKTITLTNSDKLALVDDADFEMANQFSWLLHSKGYAYRDLPRNGGKTRYQFLHQGLLDHEPGFEIDHKDLNPLNNQRDNLRRATRSQNHANCEKRTGTSSRYKGVSWDQQRKKWFAKIKVEYKQIALGRFLCEEDAARSYDQAATEFFGEFARLNFPQ